MNIWELEDNFEEGYNGPKLIGSYFNGIYERTKPDYGHIKVL